jgi:broad specificity phosphatase PhoE
MTQASRPDDIHVALIRHGQTSWNAQGRFLGHTDIGLNEEGQTQAMRLAEKLPALSAVYSSPLARALQTARAITEEPIKVPDLMELNQGELEGMLAADAIAAFPSFFRQWAIDPSNVVVPGGERLVDCLGRSLAALGRISHGHVQGERVGVVTHQLVIASVICTIEGRPLRDWRKFTVGNTAVVWLRGRGRHFEVMPAGLETPAV